MAITERRSLFLFPGVVDPTLSRIPLLPVNVSHVDIALSARSLAGVVCPQSKVCTVERSSCVATACSNIFTNSQRMKAEKTSDRVPGRFYWS